MVTNSVELSTPSTKEAMLGVAANIGKIRKLLTPEAAWIKGQETNEDDIEEWEADKKEGYVSGKKPTPAYCLIGGVHKINGVLEELTQSFLGSMVEVMGYGEIPDFNDAHATTHKQVLDFLDRSQGVAKSMAVLLPSAKAAKKKASKKPHAAKGAKKKK